MIIAATVLVGLSWGTGLGFAAVHLATEKRRAALGKERPASNQ